MILIIVFSIAGCGGGGSGTTTPQVSNPPAPPTFSVGGTISGLDASQILVAKLGEQVLQIQGEGAFVFPQGLESGDTFEMVIDAEPPRFDCDISNASGTIAEQAVSNIAIDCSTNSSADLFSLDQLHHIQLTLTLEEWRAFELDSI